MQAAGPALHGRAAGPAISGGDAAAGRSRSAATLALPHPHSAEHRDDLFAAAGDRAEPHRAVRSKAVMS